AGEMSHSAASTKSATCIGTGGLIDGVRNTHPLGDHLRPPTRWQVVAAIAAVLTALGPFLPENGATSILLLPLSFGVLFGGLFFGGLHNNPPAVAVFALAALFNALIWGGAFRVTRWGQRHLGQSRDSKPG